MPRVDENGTEWFDFFDRADMERFDAIVDRMASEANDAAKATEADDTTETAVR